MPTVSIDGAAVASGTPFDWDTTIDEDGAHTLSAVAPAKWENPGFDTIEVTVRPPGW